ncbi:MAG: hypothetical protein IPG75_20695 [Gemmatimonadetes bacterium]|nr:hypothetical protein [Gemmatimonadota bacterium]
MDVIDLGEALSPSSEHATGWVEVGRIDELGHKLGDGLAGQVDQELSRIQGTITSLLDAGWRKVRVVTDHGWLLNPKIRIAAPPGAGAYSAGVSYAHGGVSPQECVVPELTVERGAASLSARITAIEWKRLRCLVTVSSNDPTVQVDVRSNWKQAATSLVIAPKAVGVTGPVNLAVRDEYEGQAVTVVLLNATGQVLDKRSTMVGGE